MKASRWLLFIFILCVAIRLFFAFQNPYFALGDSYLNLRRIEYTANTGLPLFYDQLSYGGSHSVYMPFFYYLLAFASRFIPIIFALKILPNLFASSIIFVVYFIVKHLTKDKVSALIAAFVSGFLPIFFLETVNTVSVNSLAVPMLFTSVLFFMKHKELLDFYVIFLILFALTSSSVLLLALSLIVYLILLKTVSLKEDKKIMEIVFFTSCFSVWLNLLVYKTGLYNQGISLIWRNIPNVLLNNFFVDFSIIDAILKIGFFPFILGLYALYIYISSKRNKDVYLIASVALTSLLILWMKLVDINLGLSILGVSLSILFGVSISNLIEYIGNTKMAKFSRLVIVSIIVIIFFTSIITSIAFLGEQKIPDDGLIKSMLWLKDNTHQGKVLGNLDEGLLITSVAKRHTMVDSNFLFVNKPDKYLEDSKKIFTAQYMTDAVSLLNKYDVKYILLSDETKKMYDTIRLEEFDESCFSLVYNKSVMIFESKCKVKKDN